MKNKNTLLSFLFTLSAWVIKVLLFSYVLIFLNADKYSPDLFLIFVFISIMILFAYSLLAFGIESMILMLYWLISSLFKNKQYHNDVFIFINTINSLFFQETKLLLKHTFLEDSVKELLTETTEYVPKFKRIDGKVNGFYDYHLYTELNRTLSDVIKSQNKFKKLDIYTTTTDGFKDEVAEEFKKEIRISINNILEKHGYVIIVNMPVRQLLDIPNGSKYFLKLKELGVKLNSVNDYAFISQLTTDKEFLLKQNYLKVLSDNNLQPVDENNLFDIVPIELYTDVDEVLRRD